MGYAKRLLEEEAARAHALGKGFVCPKCVNDPHLAQEIGASSDGITLFLL